MSVTWDKDSKEGKKKTTFSNEYFIFKAQIQNVKMFLLLTIDCSYSFNGCQIHYSMCIQLVID